MTMIASLLYNIFHLWLYHRVYFAHIIYIILCSEADGSVTSVVMILLPFEINVRWQVLHSVQVELKSDVLGLSHSTTHFTNNVITLTLLQHIKGN